MEKDLVLKRIQECCKRPSRFNEILEQMLGLDPVILLSYLTELERDKKLKRFQGSWVSFNFKRSSNLDPETKPMDRGVTIDDCNFDRFIKRVVNNKPHPLDFEWRSSFSSTNRLYQEILNNCGDTDRVLLLGMPSLFELAVDREDTFHASLIDNNKLVTEALLKKIDSRSNLEVIHANVFLLDPKKFGLFKHVVIDPPWYGPHFIKFIWVAQMAMEVGGHLSICMPQILTRPSIEEELKNWFNFCKNLGLELVSLEKGALEYVSPFFEFNALRAAGIQDISPTWRKSDLCVFKKVTDVVVPTPNIEIVNSNWFEVCVKNVRIRVADLFYEPHSEFNINHIVNGDILPSVSSRNPLRSKANIWTSGNRVFQTNDPGLFRRCLNAYADSKVLDIPEFQIVSDFADYIIDLEQHEFEHYINWLKREYRA